MRRHQLQTAAFCTVAVIILLSFVSNPPRGRTGAPDELSCMDAPCHGSSPEFDGSIEFLNFPAIAVASQTFDIGFSIVATSGEPVRGGFQVVGLGNNNGQLVSEGVFSEPGPEAAVITFNDRLYLQHDPAKLFNGNDRITYTAKWTTPNDFSVDTITLYAVSVLANGNGSNSGDKVIFGELIIPVNLVEDKDGDGFNSDSDCDDNNPNINPGQEEIVNNDVDENCDGIIEEIDQDQDGFNSAEDCDDLDFNINPGALDIPNNDIDENCDGIAIQIDEDNDGFNSDDDCDDNDASANPGATEIPNNQVDEDCDGVVLVIDEDNDTWNSDIDCDDQNPNINPGRTEIPDNGIDENCDGLDETDTTMISGRVQDIFSNPTVNVRILNSANGQVLATTDQNGEFSVVVTNESIELSFAKDGDIAEGLSVSDIVLITNHLLQRRLFTSNLQNKIADVNDNGNVSTLDLVQIKNVILNRITSFGDRPIWNFDPPSVRISEIQNSINIRSYKLGDVNASARN